MNYGQRLAVAMKHAVITQAALAAACGVTQPTISYLINPNKSPSGSEFTHRFARACGVSADWLADEIGPMIPPPGFTGAIGYVVERMMKMPLREQLRFARMVDAFTSDATNLPTLPGAPNTE